MKEPPKLKSVTSDGPAAYGDKDQTPKTVEQVRDEVIEICERVGRFAKDQKPLGLVALVFMPDGSVTEFSDTRILLGYHVVGAIEAVKQSKFAK